MARLLGGDYEVVDVDRLVVHPRNPRRGHLGAVEASIEQNGFYGAVVAQRSTGHVLAGNHRLLAARASGLAHLPVIWVDVDDDEALRILLADNRVGDLAGYDDPALAALLAELEAGPGGLSGTGYSPADLEALLEALGAESGAAANTDPDDAPAVPEPQDVVSVLGDVWLLGPHRLVVGDARDPLVVERALQGRLADCVWTDPPYGVDYVGKTSDALTITGDKGDPQALAALLRSVLGNARTWSRPGASWWVCAPSCPPGGPVFSEVLSELKVWRQTIIWVKDAFVLSRQDYHHRAELVLEGEAPALLEEGAARLDPADLIAVGWRPGAAHRRPPDRRQDTVWEIPRPRASREHPTMKPVALIERAVRNHTEPREVVLDPFAGSGSTLIACHRAGRRGAAVEIDPAYADVICARWEAHTGFAPRRESTNAAVSFTRSAR